MQTNNHKINDFSATLAKKFGEVGTPERERFDEEAYSFYTSQLLLDARKEVKMTQQELADKINTTKSYISQVEHGTIIPSASVFYRIINALGMRVVIEKK